jgi:hypothetical protein
MRGRDRHEHQPYGKQYLVKMRGAIEAAVQGALEQHTDQDLSAANLLR